MSRSIALHSSDVCILQICYVSQWYGMQTHTNVSIAYVLFAMYVQFEDTVVYRGKGKGRGGAKGRTSSTQQQQQGAYASMTEMLQVHNDTYMHVIKV
jgi:hypothetical protein